MTHDTNDPWQALPTGEALRRVRHSVTPRWVAWTVTTTDEGIIWCARRLGDGALTHGDHPGRLLLWGTHSRRYFAFPMFTVPPGTIVTASEPNRLVTRMRQAEATTAVQPRMPAGPPPASQPVARR